VEYESETAASGVTAHRVALDLGDAFNAIGIEITSVREAFPQLGESGVRVGVLAVDDALRLCALLRAEESRRTATALAALAALAEPDEDGGCEK